MNAEAGQESTPFSFELLVTVHTLAQDVHKYLEFSSEVEAQLQASNARLEAKFEAHMERVPKQDHGELVDNYAWELHQFQSRFPSLNREALFLSVYNNLEHGLNRLCEGIGKEIASQIALKELHGSGIERALLFLKRIPEFDFTQVNKQISYIKDANSLRNIVAHSGGILPLDATCRANRFVQAQRTLDGKPGGPIEFRAEFMREFAANVKTLFEEIGNEMQRFMHGVQQADAAAPSR